MNKKEMREMGRKSRAAGARFELKVRKDLEEKGWITDKWTKNVDLEKMEIFQARRKFIPGKGFMGIGSGFPDFIAFKQIVGRKEDDFHAYKVVGVESKMNGVLDKAEKEKCFFLLREGVFKDILVARKGSKIGSIKYVNFESGEEVSVF
ncbi:MAG: hypothetical protein ABH864_04475 [archaeon]